MQISDVKKKVRVPMPSLESVEQICYCSHKIVESANKLGLNSRDQNKCYKRYANVFCEGPRNSGASN